MAGAVETEDEKMRTIRSNWRWNTVMFFLQALAFGASVIFVPGSFGIAVGFVTFVTLLFFCGYRVRK